LKPNLNFNTAFSSNNNTLEKYLKLGLVIRISSVIIAYALKLYLKMNKKINSGMRLLFIWII